MNYFNCDTTKSCSSLMISTHSASNAEVLQSTYVLSHFKAMQNRFIVFSILCENQIVICIKLTPLWDENQSNCDDILFHGIQSKIIRLQEMTFQNWRQKSNSPGQWRVVSFKPSGVKWRQPRKTSPGGSTLRKYHTRHADNFRPLNPCLRVYLKVSF